MLSDVEPYLHSLIELTQTAGRIVRNQDQMICGDMQACIMPCAEAAPRMASYRKHLHVLRTVWQQFAASGADLRGDFHLGRHPPPMPAQPCPYNSAAGGASPAWFPLELARCTHGKQSSAEPLSGSDPQAAYLSQLP